MVSLIADIDDAIILIIESVSMSHGTTPKVISNFAYSINDGNNVLFHIFILLITTLDGHLPQHLKVRNREKNNNKWMWDGQMTIRYDK